MTDSRGTLRSLIEKAGGPGFSAATSEASVFEQLIVPLLRDVLGWRTDQISEFDRQTYSRGSGVADGVFKDSDTPVLYVEAKRIGKIPKLSELRGRATFYSREEEQAIRYARRSTGMREGERWTVLTDFFRLRVFEASREELVLAFDSPEELEQRFDELMLLSRDAVVSGRLHKHHLAKRKPEIDTDFRNMLLHWRKRLAQQLYDSNRDRFSDGGELAIKELQAAVQRLLDRLIIIQFAADVDALEGEDPLRDLLDRTAPARRTRSLVQPSSLRDALFSAFHRFDELYNTSLFAPGHVLESLNIDDSTLTQLLESIAGQSFRRLDADILGTTYETYLGHKLRVIDHVVSMEGQADVRRSGGVYYTPVEVVKAIVERTVGAQLEKATTPSEVDEITVVDPACGSGSFLIQAFDRFADWYEAENARRFTAMPAVPTMEEVAVGPIVDYGRRILEKNIYGVDLDPEAVELASVNLILQAMRRGTPGLHLGRLPLILGQNLKVGNSVVPGHFAQRPMAVPDERLALAGDARRALAGALTAADEARALIAAAEASAAVSSQATTDLAGTYPEIGSRVPFWWEAEFPELFSRARQKTDRGFAVVIGNPPWIGFQGDVEDRGYLSQAYDTATGRFDIYVPFLELACELTRAGGLIGMITPSNYFLRDYGRQLRERLRDQETILEIIDFGSRQLFEGATNYPAIIILRHGVAPDGHELSYVRDSYDPAESQPHHQARVPSEGWVFWSPLEAELMAHVKALADIETLEDVCRAPDGSSGLAEGVVTGQNAVFLVDSDVAASEGFEADLIRPCAKGTDVSRWAIAPPSRYLIYPYRDGSVIPEEELAAQAPKVYRWLNKHKTIGSRSGGLAGRSYIDASKKYWYELWNQRSEVLLAVPKLITPEISNRPEFAVVDAAVAFTDSVTSATPSIDSGYCREYLAGVLNSRLMTLLHARLSVPKANGYLIFRPAFLARLPIRRPDLGQPEDRLLHDGIVGSVRACAELSAEVREANRAFAEYHSDFTITTRTLASVINRLTLDHRRSLVQAPGQLLKLGARRDGPWLVVTGRTKTRALDGGAFDIELRDLLKVRLPEPVASFLELYLPGAAAFQGRANRHRTLSARASEVLLPDMTEQQMADAAARYRADSQRVANALASLEALEREIDGYVAALYQLTPAMVDAVAQFLPPVDTESP